MGGMNPGNEAAAKMDITSGLKFLQRALPNLPMGSDLHTDILKAVMSISKHASQPGEPEGPQAQNIQSMARQMGQNAHQVAAMRQVGGGPTSPGAPPAMAGAQPEAA